MGRKERKRGADMTQCLLKIREKAGKMSQSENALAQYILQNPLAVVSMMIDDLAARCGTSKSTVVRFCKDLGYKGYKELCMQLNADLMSGTQENLSYAFLRPDDSVQTVLQNISENNIKTIRNTIGVLEPSQLDRVVEKLAAAPRVDFYGVGNSGFIALDAQGKFLRVGKISMAETDPHMQMLTAATLGHGDAAVLISYSGETKDILETARIVKQTGAAVVSLTKYGANSLSEVADLTLFTVSEEGMIRSGAMSSRIGQLTVIDILFTMVAGRCYPEAKASLDRTTGMIRRKKTSHFKEREQNNGKEEQ